MGIGAIFPLLVWALGLQPAFRTLDDLRRFVSGKPALALNSCFAVSTNRSDRLVFRCIVWNRRVWGFLRGFMLKIRCDGA